MTEKIITSSLVKKIALIGVSTGGPSTLRTLFKLLPENLNICIVVVIHINQSSAGKLCALLDECCKCRVVSATDKTQLQNNKIFICSGGEFNYEITRELKIATVPHFEKQIYKPSVNILFESAVRNVKAAKLMTILLTGMGNDGANGIAEAYDAGCITVIQDEKSSVIYGMPRAAKIAGKFNYEASIEEVAELIKKFGADLL